MITPGGNWSSYPAHKHDRRRDRVRLEEIYYFEVAAGPTAQPGFGYHRTSSSPGSGRSTSSKRCTTGDTVLVPYGWHGPCVAAPGFDMYYLNVMAGGLREREAGAWKISDHPDQGWIRSTWDIRGRSAPDHPPGPQHRTTPHPRPPPTRMP